MYKGKKRPQPGKPAARQAEKIRHYEVKEQAELLPFLLQHITGAGRNVVKSILAGGQVSVGGKPVTAYNYALQPGQTVSVSKEKQKQGIPFMGLSILFEDEHIIVIKKDAGLLSVASDNGKDTEVTAYRQLMAHVRLEAQSSRIFVVHRLDRDTSGVMLFAKSEAVQQKLQSTWQESVQERLYVALVEGIVKQEQGTVKSWLKESKTLRMYSSAHPNDGQLAVTHYKRLRAGNGHSLLEVNLETGRKNQIRVHLSDIGHPIADDKKYGAAVKTIGRLGLHARVLAFVHPATNKLMRFETDVPKLFLRPFQQQP